jgi:uncharacterized membrane protein
LRGAAAASMPQREPTLMQSESAQHYSTSPVPWFSAFFVVILATGLFFRFTNLDKKVYWNDEVGMTVKLSGHTVGEMINQLFDGGEIGVEDLHKYQRVSPEKPVRDTIIALATEDAHLPPLYYLLARLWARIFGDSVQAIRSLSAVISLLVFPCVYWLCRELFESPLTGWLAVALMAVSPFHVLYAQEAYQYSLWTVTVLLASAALLWALRVQTGRSWAIYTASVAMGLYTHLLFGLVVIAHGVYVAGMNLGKINPKEFRLPKALVSYLLATVTGLFAFSPWAAVIIVKHTRIQPSWLTKDISFFDRLEQWSYNFGSVFLDTGGYLYGIGSPTIEKISLTILALAGYSIWFVCSRTEKRTWLFVVTLTGSVFISLALADLIWGGGRSAVARYLIPSYLGVQLAFAHLLAFRIVSVGLLQRKIWQAVMAVVMTAGIASCAISAQAETWWNKAGSRTIPELARIINRFPGPLVISDSSGLNPGNVVSLSYLVEPKVRFRLVVPPNVPTIPDGFSDVFLFNPSESLRQALQTDGKRRIESVYADGMLWRLVP